MTFLISSILSLMKTQASVFDEELNFNQANRIDQQIVRLAAKGNTKPVAYQYPKSKDVRDNMMENGLLAPSQLEGTRYFQQVIDNYKSRMEEQLDYSESNVLEFLDYYHGNIFPKYHAGRNMIFAMFDIVPKGISPGHDKLIKEKPVAIDITKLAKIKGDDVRFFIIELPFQDEKNRSKEIQVEDFPWLNRVDFMSFYDKKRSGGLLFGDVPHLAIWVKDGVIPPKCLS